METYTVPELKCFGRIVHLTLSNSYTQQPPSGWIKEDGGNDWLTDQTGIPADDYIPPGGG